MKIFNPIPCLIIAIFLLGTSGLTAQERQVKKVEKRNKTESVGASKSESTSGTKKKASATEIKQFSNKGPKGSKISKKNPDKSSTAKQAEKKYQKKKKLAADGIVGPKTINKVDAKKNQKGPKNKSKKHLSTINHESDKSKKKKKRKKDQ